MNGKTTRSTVIAGVLSPRLALGSRLALSFRLALSLVAALLAAVVWAADEEPGLNDVEPGSPLILIYPPSPPSIYSAPPLKSAKAKGEKLRRNTSQSQAAKTWRGIRLQSPAASTAAASREIQRDGSDAVVESVTAKATESAVEQASENPVETPAKNTTEHSGNKRLVDSEAERETPQERSPASEDESVALPTPVAEAVFDQILEDTLLDISAVASELDADMSQAGAELKAEAKTNTKTESTDLAEADDAPLSTPFVKAETLATEDLSSVTAGAPLNEEPRLPLQVRQGKSWQQAGRDHALSFSGIFKALKGRFAANPKEPVAAARNQKASTATMVDAAANKKLREAQIKLLRELPLPMSQLDVAVADVGLRSYPSATADISPLWAAGGFHGIEHGAGSAPVAVFVDGVYLGEHRGIALGFFDVQAMSFSPGPAPMSYAPAALSGAMRLQSKAPSGEPHARFSLGADDNGSAWAGIAIDTAEIDGLAMRLSYRHTWQDGQIERGAGDNFAAGDIAQLRFALREQTSETLHFSYRYERDDAELNPHYYQLLRGSPTATEARQSEGQWSEAPRPNRIDQRRHLLGLRWLHERGELLADSLIIDGQSTVSQDFGAGAPLYFQRQAREQQYYQQSLRWLSAPIIDNADTRLRFELGAVYTEQDASLTLRDEEGQGGTLWRDSEQHRDLRQFAADMRWILEPLSLSPALQLEAAASWQRRDLDVRHQAMGDSFNAFSMRDERRDSLLSTELLARWAISESLRLEAQLRRAEQAGGFAETGSEAHWRAGGYDPESRFYRALSLYGQHFNQRLNWHLRLHQTRVEDAQYAMARDLDQPLLRDIFNSAEADIRGASLAAQWQFAAGWQWNIAYDYLDASYSDLRDQTAFLPGAIANPNLGADISKEAQLAYTPEYSYGSSVLYVRPLGDADLKAGLHYRWQGKRRSRVVDQQIEAFELEHHSSLNARLELNGLRLSRDARMGLGLWANNLDDEDYLLDSQALPSGEVSARFADERSVGLDMHIDFD